MSFPDPATTEWVPIWNINAPATIQDEGTPLTPRSTVNYVGAGVVVTDDAANGRTVVTIAGGASGQMQTPWLSDINGANFRLVDPGALYQVTSYAPWPDANSAAISLRETNRIGYINDIAYSPRIAFVWIGMGIAQIGLEKDGLSTIRTFNNAGTGYVPFAAASISANGALSVTGDIFSEGILYLRNRDTVANNFFNISAYHDGIFINGPAAAIAVLSETEAYFLKRIRSELQIESRSGGFVFPDSTVQTTAALTKAAYQTPWTQNINAAGFDLTGVGRIVIGSPSYDVGYKFVVAGNARVEGNLDIEIGAVTMYGAGKNLAGNGGNIVGFSGFYGSGNSEILGSLYLGPNPRSALIMVLSDGAADSGAMVFSTRSLGALAERMRISAAGNVGINKNNPAYSLDIVGGHPTIVNVNPSDRADYVAGFYIRGRAALVQYGLPDNRLRINPANQYAIVEIGRVVEGNLSHLLVAGNIGVNVDSPAYRLDVSGDCNITGVYRVNGVPIATGGVSSVFTRTGAVVAAAGDYTAAQITNAVSTLGSYADPSWITSLAWSKLTGVPSSFTPSAHVHSGADITTGLVAPARLGTGTPSASNYLRGDGTWQTVSAGSAQTPWTSNIDGGGFSLSNASSITSTGFISAVGQIKMINSAANDSYFFWYQGALARWSFGKSADAESGGNAGSNLQLNRYADGGGFLSNVIDITRSTGLVALSGDLSLGPQPRNAVISVSADGATDSGAILFSPRLFSGLTERMRLRANGDLGLGTSDPKERLTVESASPVVIRQSVPGARGCLHYFDGSSYFVLFTGASDPHGSFTGFRPLVMDGATGFVGIGASPDLYQLSVTGDLNITGTYRKNGTPIGITNQNVVSRTIGTVYQNTGIKALFVQMICACANNAGATAYTDSTTNPTTPVASVTNAHTTAVNLTVSFWVLPGWYYKITGSGTNNGWVEWT